MTIVFLLSMPNNNSWNGRWSGDGECYAVVRSVSDAKKRAEKNRTMLAQRHFSYNFGDGWRASIEVKLVTPSEARSYRKHSKGFCGYEWMIESILEHGEIRCEGRDDNGRRWWQTSGNGEIHYYDAAPVGVGA